MKWYTLRNSTLCTKETQRDIIAKNYRETYYLDNGKAVTEIPRVKENCYYQGYLQNESRSSASISTCEGLKGFFKTEAQSYLIEPLKLRDGNEHAVYKYEDLKNVPKTCGVTNTTWEEDPNAKTSRSRSSQEGEAFLKAEKYIELRIVADNSMYQKYNKSMETIRKRIFEIINYVNSIYKLLRIFVALNELEVWTDTDKIDVTTSANDNLDRFSNWRRTNLLNWTKNDNAQFITNTDFDGPTVGLAYVGTICSNEHSAGVIQDHSRLAVLVGSTVAHEMGHNIGMNHDTQDCTCTSHSCIMAPSLSYNTPREFSSCSYKNFDEFMLTRMPECLRNKPKKTDITASPVCGNNFVEVGEQCDCGTPDECRNPCCNADTCTLKGEANCADGECCENCQIKSAGQVCRVAKDDCDISEMCDGQSPDCPYDSFRINGFPCNNEEGYCYIGKCSTLQSQCIKLWGAAATVAIDDCFRKNTKGMNYGFCYQSEDSFVPCKTKDIKCGVLFCQGGSDLPTAYGTMVQFSTCKGVISTTPNNLGMVENGTKCGSGMVCIGGECVDTETAYRAEDCAAKCSGHAVCDHQLKCQCEEGWAPPNCDSASGKSIGIIVAIVLLVIIVCAIVIGLLVRYRKFPQALKQLQSSQPTATVDGVSNPTFAVQEQNKRQNLPIVHTPELTARSLLYPPPPPGQAAKPKLTFYNAPDGARYSSPQHVLASSGPELKSSSTSFENSPKPPKKPTTGPPPVPVLKPDIQQPQAPKPSNPPSVPKGKPVLPAPPPQALKPTKSKPK
ncbi:zinc metalloproteinase-disintegrin-like batroxstatin-1 isoform X2 [Rhinatrema bivittatum]|uniref:zinc metalloproteinase-disintegrin-like batroxstatin-1 isoform X2 n=1 Tax=Rhinatrema bivittatum TaxID=194408 RepID=UPI00112C0864|nr:zinc metalloproteinase-disintegrin-like batroxstatin-1 isoform X2 [Rhinatrema bivittatum]